ncbi:thiamine diphosphokinase [Gracilibacillus thailandensis]|uniref:Thiamine diphosphokinase n=1 Tax=Gracilibacillus thailandensis TaxID=563735 RepID=A0A6N7R446_9BACI|nr:thiamine diphosphokinase [Gracilibacillus thailandensis]MRI67976.1 thiamine diphosphokinase [Gracilibacillus thailandensis]
MNIGIVAGGPEKALASLLSYRDDIDIWIGADLGASYLLRKQLPIDIAIGDFDSLDKEEKLVIKKQANSFREFPPEKNETDLELAVEAALSYQPASIFLFGVTAGRLDHELANIQLLYRLLEKNVTAKIIDHKNILSIYKPGHYCVQANSSELISFIPLTPTVEGLTLDGFYYPLDNYTVTWGSTRCISNQLIKEQGTFFFNDGILIMIKSTE